MGVRNSGVLFAFTVDALLFIIRKRDFLVVSTVAR